MELLSVSVVCWIHLVFCLLCFRFKNSWNLPNYISGRNELWLICSANTWIPPASSMAQNGIFSFDVQSYTENFWTLNRSSLTTIQENSEKLKSVVIHLAQIIQWNISVSQSKILNVRLWEDKSFALQTCQNLMHWILYKSSQISKLHVKFNKKTLLFGIT